MLKININVWYTTDMNYWGNILEGSWWLFLHSTCFFLILFKWEDNYNIVMVFAVHEYELDVGICVSPPS